MHKDTPFKARINGDRCVLVLGDDAIRIEFEKFQRPFLMEYGSVRCVQCFSTYVNPGAVPACYLRSHSGSCLCSAPSDSWPALGAIACRSGAFRRPLPILSSLRRYSLSLRDSYGVLVLSMCHTMVIILCATTTIAWACLSACLLLAD